MARTQARNGFKKAEWEKRFYSRVKEEMDVFEIKIGDIAKVVGVSEDTMSIKLNDPSKLSVEEICILCDFLTIDRSDLIELRPKGFKRK